MTEDELARLFQRAADTVPPVANPIAGVIARGRRRRLARRSALGAGSLAALAVIGGITVNLLGGSDAAATSSTAPFASDPSATSASSTSSTAFSGPELADGRTFTMPSGASVAVSRVRHTAGVIGGDQTVLADAAGGAPQWLLTLSGSSSASQAASDGALLHTAYPRALVLQERSAEELRAAHRAEAAEEKALTSAMADHPVTLDLPGWTCHFGTKANECTGPGGKPAVMVQWGTGTGRATQVAGLAQQGTVPMLAGTGLVLHDPSATPIAESTGGTDHGLGGTSIVGPQLADGTYVWVAYYPFAGTTLHDMKQVASALHWQ